jgi:hypothetical protein
MAKTTTLLDRARDALRELKGEAGTLISKRQAQLVAGAAVATIAKIDAELGAVENAAGIEADRISLLEGELAREREAERLAGKLQRIEQVEQLFQQRDAAGLEAVEAIKALDAAYRKLFLLAAEIRDAWPFRLVDCAPILVSETEIEAKVAAEIWRVGGRSPPTGGATPNRDGGSLPNARAPSMGALGQPSSVEPFENVLRNATQFASGIMRQGKSSGPIEGAAARVVGSSGRTLQQLIAEQMRLADMDQNNPEVEREYNAVIAEMTALPMEGNA